MNSVTEFSNPGLFFMCSAANTAAKIERDGGKEGGINKILQIPQKSPVSLPSEVALSGLGNSNTNILPVVLHDL